MRTYRRHAIVGALLVSAVLTPPDPVSQLMIALPLVLLYQFSILLSRFAHYRRKKELDAALGEGVAS